MDVHCTLQLTARSRIVAGMYTHLWGGYTRTAFTGAVLPVSTTRHVHTTRIHLGGAPGIRVAIYGGARRVDSSSKGEGEDAVATRACPCTAHLICNYEHMMLKILKEQPGPGSLESWKQGNLRGEE